MTDAETIAVLTHHDAHLRSRLAPWVERITAVIQGKFADAAAHAAKAITDTLRRTPDGRATDRRAIKSPSFQAAMSRLDELASLLSGPSVHSLDGLIRDARESFYRDSFELWKKIIPAATWVSADAQPTQIGVARVRGVPIHGVDVRVEVVSAIGSAKDDLRRAVNSAATTDPVRSLANDRLATWKRMKGDSLVRGIVLELSDSNVVANTQAAIDLVHPDNR